VAYNVVILVAFLATWLGITAVASPHLPPGQDAIEPMVLFLFIPRYLLIANVCYASCWLVAVGLRLLQVKPFGPSRGWAFLGYSLLSCLVTSIPFWCALVYWMGRPLVAQ